MTAPPIPVEGYPFATSPAPTETQFYRMSRAWAGDGIDEEVYGTGSGQLQLDSATRTVTVAPYYAHVGGAVANQPAPVTVDMPAAASQARIDRVITRRDPAADQCVLDVLQGTPGSSVPPALTRDPDGVWEYSHGQVQANPNGTLTGHVTERVFLSRSGRYGVSTFRPPDRQLGEVFFEYDTGHTVQWDGVTWRLLHSDTGWVSITQLRPLIEARGGAPQVRRTGAGLVSMRGGVQKSDGTFILAQGGSGDNIDPLCTLPAGFRPVARAVNVPCAASMQGSALYGAARLDILPDGVVNLAHDVDVRWVTFNSVNFWVD